MDPIETDIREDDCQQQPYVITVNNNVELLEKVPNLSSKERIVSLLSFISSSTALGAVVLSFNSLVLIAGLLTLPLSYYMYIQSKNLVNIATLEQTGDRLEEESTQVKNENRRLCGELQKLESTLYRLEEVEQTLDTITLSQKENVGLFSEVVKQNRAILKRMEGNRKSLILQNLLTLIMRSDTDQNFKLEAHELDDLCQHLSQIQGIKFYEDRFRTIVTKNNCNGDGRSGGGDLQSLMKSIQSLMNTANTATDGKNSIHNDIVLFEILNE